MLTRTRTLSAAAIAFAAMALTVSAHAQETVTQTFQVPERAIGFTQSIPYQQFDASLGTLTKTNWSMATSLTVTSEVLNITNTEQPVWNITLTVPISFVISGPATVITVAEAGPYTGIVNPGINLNTGPTATSTASLDVLPQSLGMYSSQIPTTGTITVLANTQTASGQSESGVFYGGTATVAATIVLTYTYTPNGISKIAAIHPSTPTSSTLLYAGITGSCPWASEIGLPSEGMMLPDGVYTAPKVSRPASLKSSAGVRLAANYTAK